MLTRPLKPLILSTSIYDLVLIYACHFHHHPVIFLLWSVIRKPVFDLKWPSLLVKRFSAMQGYYALDMFKLNQNGFIRAWFGKSADECRFYRPPLYWNKPQWLSDLLYTVNIFNGLLIIVWSWLISITLIGANDRYWH